MTVPAQPQLVIRIKMDGGKGVVIARTPQEANQFIADVFNEKFGPTNAITMTIDYLAQADIPAAPPQSAREAIARKIAAWIGYSFDGLPHYNTVGRGFPEWPQTIRYHGGKPDLLRLADALMAQCPDDAGLRAAAERVCWFDWSDNDMDARAAIDALRKAVTDTRPDGS